MNQSINLKCTCALLLIPFLLACFGLAPMAQAVGPDTDGNIPGANNGEGIGVLVSRTTGIWNTGTGFEALNHLTAGNQNTATGLRALNSDTNGGFNTATGVLSLFSNTSGLAVIRSRTTRTVTTTRPTVMERSISTMPTTTRPLVLLRSIKTPPAPITTQSVPRRSLTTSLAFKTRPWVLSRCQATSLALST